VGGLVKTSENFFTIIHIFTYPQDTDTSQFLCETLPNILFKIK
jgi:hypothetical protein